MSTTNYMEVQVQSCNLNKALMRDPQVNPWITLPPGYSFKVIFPFGGAAARFLVCKTDNPHRWISVYLDTIDMLGYMGHPYWEAYPIGDDVERFALDDSAGLVNAIVKELESNSTT